MWIAVQAPRCRCRSRPPPPARRAGGMGAERGNASRSAVQRSTNSPKADAAATTPACAGTAVRSTITRTPRFPESAEIGGVQPFGQQSPLVRVGAEAAIAPPTAPPAHRRMLVLRLLVGDPIFSSVRRRRRVPQEHQRTGARWSRVAVRLSATAAWLTQRPGQRVDPSGPLRSTEAIARTRRWEFAARRADWLAA